MKLIANIARILVGIEFVFSGFVKVVDPYGTGLKLQEYFEVFAQDLPAMSGVFEIFANQSQLLSLLFCAGELILGVALLVKFKMPQTAWIVLAMMGFFTFLTFYSAYFNKVTDCGCFGDFLKLKPWTSFYKDIISLAVILIIFFYRKKFGTYSFALPVTLIGTVIAFGIGIYGKMYLPMIDFLPYAKDLNIRDQMQPTGIKPEFVYTFLDKESNNEITSAEYLMDTNKYMYVSSIILNEDLLRPKITDYSISDIEGNDVTGDTFENAKLLVCIKKKENISISQLSSLAKLGQDLKVADAMVVSSLGLEELGTYLSKSGINIPAYSIDEKVLKTMARTNPCIILLQNGTVKAKWSHRSIPTAEEVESILK
ncbi:DoxX protein [Spirosomataceae bacterium TFI 002]|nr:DoxX protein [Spirosomataceae bacterium TFI 002]